VNSSQDREREREREREAICAVEERVGVE